MVLVAEIERANWQSPFLLVNIIVVLANPKIHLREM